MVLAVFMLLPLRIYESIIFYPFINEMTLFKLHSPDLLGFCLFFHSWEHLFC
ncbi:hypothetical protein SAMN05421740_102295 [Parapedobacter koreensis]|uniref:Uncharacterized protein n=1 Tax=Parapedobacter koreensis TaxID=332977 RepID=A0A1H7IMX7_9SPHI|nr:hypothetical protein SAMN05421740_102295 [Parapedobacter koreensis]